MPKMNDMLRDLPKIQLQFHFTSNIHENGEMGWTQMICEHATMTVLGY
jgi:hypothetical protein